MNKQWVFLTQPLILALGILRCIHLFTPSDSIPVVVSQGFCDKYHNLGGLKQQSFIPSQFWRLEVGDQGGGRAMLLSVSLTLPCFFQFLLTLGFPWLVAASLQSLPSLSHSVFSLNVSLPFTGTLVIGDVGPIHAPQILVIRYLTPVWPHFN